MKYLCYKEGSCHVLTYDKEKIIFVGRRGLTDKSVDLRSRRQGTGDRIPEEDIM